jgi:putative component of membrane protein insertase Oxa1/YidC/SpoIIIJ protein YidD
LLIDQIGCFISFLAIICTFLILVCKSKNSLIFKYNKGWTNIKRLRCEPLIQPGVDFIKVGRTAYRVKRTQIRKKRQKLGHKVKIQDAKLGKKDGRRVQISSLGHKLLYEIHPWLCNTTTI